MKKQRKKSSFGMFEKLYMLKDKSGDMVIVL